MHLRVIAVTAVLGCASLATAQPPQLNVVEFPSGDPAVFVVDVAVDVGVDDAWTAAGLSARTFAGAAFRYRYRDEIDPNAPHVPLLTNVEPDNVRRDRAITFVNQPRAQTSNSRFRIGGAAALAGGYDPPTPYPSADATFVNVAFFREGIDEITDGYIERVAIDISGTGFSLAQLYLSPTGQPEMPGHLLIVAGETAVATHLFPTPLTIRNWAVFAVPEPAALALLAVSGLMALRRR